jgi:hypothetical protein
MKSKECPYCAQQIEIHADGSFVMHADSSGGVCQGTNCESFEMGGTLSIGCMRILIQKAVIDPDAEGIDE